MWRAARLGGRSSEKRPCRRLLDCRLASDDSRRPRLEQRVRMYALKQLVLWLRHSLAPRVAAVVADWRRLIWPRYSRLALRVAAVFTSDFASEAGTRIL